MYNIFYQKIGSGTRASKSKAGWNVNEVLAKGLQKAVITKFKRRKVYARFKDNVWAADLAEMG